jgi:hypothetical protein
MTRTNLNLDAAPGEGQHSDARDLELERATRTSKSTSERATHRSTRRAPACSGSPSSMAEMGAGANGALDISLMKKIFYNCLLLSGESAPCPTEFKEPSNRGNQ